MTLESLNKRSGGLTNEELKALKDIDSGKVKITRYKNINVYLRHLREESKK